MTSMNNKKKLLIALMGFLLLAIPVIVASLPTKQVTRSKAAPSTTITFSPASSPSNPIQKNTGDIIPLDIIVNPGTNMVTFVRFQINYDNTKLALADTNAFTPNISAFPNTVEGPITGPGSIAASLSVGSDPTKAIQKSTKLGTLTFKAIAATQGQPAMVTFTSMTQALSSGPNDQAGENILSSTTPAAITISGNTISITPSQTPSSVPSGAVTPSPETTILNFTRLLHGVGSAGDNPNPGGSDLSNKNPLHPQRNLDIQIYDSSNKLAAKLSGSIIYDSNAGNFAGKVDLGASFASGNYNIKVKTDRYLRKLIPGIQAINTKTDNNIPQFSMIAGDINGDNVLNILDYNILLDCGYGQLNPLPMADPNSVYNSQPCQAHNPLTQFTDLDDNGIVNSPDYNLFLRELSVQNGD